MNLKVNPAGSHVPALSASSHQSVSKPGTADPFSRGSDPVLPEDVLPLRLKTVAQLTEVSEKTVRRWIQRGLLRSHKLGGARVVRRRDLRSFLDQQAGETNKEQP